MTIIEQIKAEIERRKGYYRITNPYDKRAIRVCEDLLSFLSTLESEKPMNPSEHRDPCGLRGPSGVDGDKNWYLLDQEIIDWCGKFRPSIREAIQSTAYHFADWQKEQTEKRWLEDRDGCFWDGVNEGKKAMKEQMLKEAVECETVCIKDRLAAILPMKEFQWTVGDKVRVIIIKDDGKSD